MSRVKLPDKSKWFPMFETECRNECLNNCTCMAYAYYDGVGCMMWDEGLIDVQKFTSDGADLYIRLVDSELGNKKDQKAIIATTVVLGTIFIYACTYFLWKLFLNNKSIIYIYIYIH
ncbi:hypothetical protein BUALT_Bualt18G0105100 [Buddleja alternifolia]|uniref:Apple domain-containing protein n=1 Tax=Buddleja alternifolia TaxID=168488 RepID=A0AAV6WEQ8_9LAMI|nr:hypothetical protein BUALT_Bualt18G0105100 [Buddleja alternifolia]